MSDARCPWCRENIDHDLSTDENWDEPGFDTNCKKCGKPLDVVVEVIEYRYTARKGIVEDVHE
jgi:hypothetical protein